MTAYLLSHRGHTPIKVWRKPGMRCPLVINSDRRLGKAKLLVPADCCVYPVDVPTATLGAARSMLNTGASTEKYMSVAPESTMPVVLFWSARLQSLWVQLSVNLLMSGKGECGYVELRVGLKLAVVVINISMRVSLDSFFAALLTVPHRHNPIFQLGGRLYLLFARSKQVSGS